MLWRPEAKRVYVHGGIFKTGIWVTPGSAWYSTSGGLSRLQYNSSQLGVVSLRVAKYTAPKTLRNRETKLNREENTR